MTIRVFITGVTGMTGSYLGEAETLQILTVFGTRPEAIKLTPVIRELRKHPDRAVCKVCVTARHGSGEQGNGGQRSGRAEVGCESDGFFTLSKGD
jgi:hypothetical protein